MPARRDLGQALLRLSEPGGPEDGGNLARHTLAQAMRDLGQHVALQMDSTALAAHLGQEAAHRGCQARVLIRDHELDAAETTLQELLEAPTSCSPLPSVCPGAGGGRPGPRRRPRARSRSRPFGPSGHEERRPGTGGVGPLDACTPQRLHALVGFATGTVERPTRCLGHVAHLALRSRASTIIASTSSLLRW